MAQIYASEFTEKELVDLVAFYKTPLGQKLLTSEPKAINESLQYMQQWAQQFGAARQRPVQGRDEEARQGYLSTIPICL